MPRTIKLAPPREPSAAGMIAFSWIIGVLSASRTMLEGLLLAVTAVLVHLLTFDAILDALRRSRIAALALYVTLNGVPYIVAVASWRDYTLLAALLVALPVLAAYAVLAKRGLLKTPAGYIAGASLLTYTSILAATTAGEPTRLTLLAFTVTMLYTASSTAYVESRLPIRDTSPLLPLGLWMPAIITAALLEPILLLAAIEPTARFIANAVRNTKIDMRSIKRLGLAELVRLATYTMLMTIAITHPAP